MFPNWIWYILGKKSSGGDSPTPPEPPTPTKVVVPQGMRFGYSYNFPETFDDFDFSEITDSSYMFQSCGNYTSSSITDIVIPSLNLPNVTKAESMFTTMQKVVEVGDLTFTNIESLYHCFYSNYSLKKVGKISFKYYPGVIDFEQMFNLCSNLEDVSFEIIDIGTQYQTCKVNSMFSNCTKLSDNTLNNILEFCTHIYPTTYRRRLTDLGITDSNLQARIPNLSNYQAFLDAGWTIS